MTVSCCRQAYFANILICCFVVETLLFNVFVAEKNNVFPKLRLLLMVRRFKVRWLRI